MSEQPNQRRRIALTAGWIVWCVLLGSIAKEAAKTGTLWSRTLTPGQTRRRTPRINQLWLSWAGVSLLLLWAHKRMPKTLDADAEARPRARNEDRGAAAFSGVILALLGLVGLLVSLLALAVGPAGGLFQVLGLFWPGHWRCWRSVSSS